MPLLMTPSLSRYKFQIDTLLFQHPYRWIIFTQNQNENILRNVRALVDSDIIIPQTINHNDSDSDADIHVDVDVDDDDDEGYDLKQFYKIDKDNSGEIYYEHYGKWNRKQGFVDERVTKVIARRRGNIKGKLITASYVHLNRSSKDHLLDFVDKNVDSLMKMNYAIVDVAMEAINATKKDLFQLTWGYLNARTKKWSGMMGDVVHKGADIVGNLTKHLLFFLTSNLDKSLDTN
jgi:hypothetical protein